MNGPGLYSPSLVRLGPTKASCWLILCSISLPPPLSLCDKVGWENGENQSPLTHSIPVRAARSGDEEACLQVLFIAHASLTRVGVSEV